MLQSSGLKGCSVFAVRIRCEGCSNESAIEVNVELIDVLMGYSVQRRNLSMIFFCSSIFQWYFSKY
jgi:hypothetical protein